MTFIFMNTLPEPYYDKMIGNVIQNFAEMVWSGELIEQGITNKKIERKLTSTPPTKKVTPAKKKEKDARAVFINQQSKGQTSYASQPFYSVNPLPLIQPLSFNGTLTAPPAQVNSFKDNRGASISQGRAKDRKSVV